MDLCVSCKGCKRDCPTGVDMARMKIEFLSQWRQTRGLALKDKIIATLPRWAPWAGRLPFLFNLRDTLPGAAWLSERLLDRKSVVQGKSVSVRLDLGGRRHIKTKQNKNQKK